MNDVELRIAALLAEVRPYLPRHLRTLPDRLLIKLVELAFAVALEKAIDVTRKKKGADRAAD